MKRFEDVLRLISGVLLGTLVRDFDALRTNFADLFSVTNHYFDVVSVGRLTTIVLIAVFLRNIHGSARYDEMVEKLHLLPPFERTYRGRVLTFCFSLAALFGGPALVDHYIVHDAVSRGPGTGMTVSALMSGEWFCVVLFSSLGVYFVWDALLWIWGDDGSEDESSIQRVLYNWIRIDCYGLLAFIGITGFELYARAKGGTFNYELWAVTYVLIAGFIVVRDYYVNQAFYFPEP